MEQELIFLLEKLNNNALITIMFIIVSASYVIKFFTQVVWPFITKHEKYKSARQMLKDDIVLREQRQTLVDEKFKSIESQIDLLAENIFHSNKLNLIQSKGIFENMVFNKGLDPFRRLKALRRLLALHGNGEAKQEGLIAALNNPSDWRKVLSLGMRFKCTNYSYYLKSIEEINKKIFDHGLTYEPNDEGIELVEGQTVNGE